jgi:asparagine N-glycosylation enzyme membrane subunit Stt3
MRRQVPLALCFIAGTFMAVQYFIPHPAVQQSYDQLLNWLQTLLAFSFLIGTVSLVRVHYHRIRHRTADRGYSWVLFVGLTLMLIFGFALPEHKNPGSLFDIMFQNVQVPIEATMFSLLAFYIASAAFRAFRARTLEATLLLVAASIVMVGRVPIGDVVSSLIPKAANWILIVPNLAAKRGIMIGVGLGMMATALKIVLGIERAWMGGSD